DIARHIGTEDFAANMPEYCGVISVKPTTRARPERIEQEERNFDFAVLEKAIADRREENIDEMMDNIVGLPSV
ncbi:MAG TPA: tRNA 4-thiouridine(8) synthase ThiI, partial [Porticoccaceae bacterium]|nr:tRNA 4-thiouridine(8) synthase ThiI [Porticoccaceae bacterium]